jgi:hypothetical protein
MWMLDGSRREAWNHTASLLAQQSNLHRDPQSKPLPPEEFLPESLRPSAPPAPKDEGISFSQFKQVMTGAMRTLR